MAKKGKKDRGNNRPGSPGASYQMPPFLSYDPTISAEQRAQERGLEDLEFDLKRGGKRAKKDYRTSRKDLKRDYGRGTEDISRNLYRDLEDLGLRRSDAGRDYGRGVEDIGTRRSDLDTDFSRGNEDFGFQLEALGRRYNRLGQAQQQNINATGQSAGGATAAAAAKRAENQAFERRPIDTGITRLGEDYTRDTGLLERTGTRLGEDFGSELERIGLSEGRATDDASRNQTYLNQDFRHDRGLMKRDYKWGRQDRKLEKQRGRREQAIGHQDLTQQAIWQARQMQPGTFSRLGNKTSRKKK
jgi:hypothetical protein